MKPFNPQQLPITDIPWDALIPLIGKANRSLAYYDGILYGLASPRILLSPLTTQEAVLSSKIEGTQATLGEVLKFEAGETPAQESRVWDIEEIMNYRRAMRHAEEKLKVRPFSLNLLKDLHAILLNGVRGKFKARGKFRSTQNWIGKPGTPIEEAQYIPPAPNALNDCLDNWEKYYHVDRPDPLVQLAIIHAQFEMIHPFLDGNGRLGRMIVPLFLFEKKLISSPVFYISAYLEKNRQKYVAGLQGLAEKTPDAWARWIGFFLSAMDEQSKENARKAQAIIDLYNRLKNEIVDLTRSQYAVPLLDCLFDQPVFTSALFDNRKGMPSKPMVMNMLGRLKKEGIIKVVREGSGRRPQILALTKLINICEGKNVLK
ncbi:MAG TPA: Fic/DOC family N-terminal domain-containing protein [Smithellaceae bacterium]|nr:Fic/DOC family N-terminal domain-containing protein [Smithellaceae bacterium]HRV27065.1 Fic/DOC family N-terminal domain-containing protein [Smithellaceae bacterium]